MELPRKNRLVDVERERMRVVGVTKEDAKDWVGWRRMIHGGDP